MREPWMLAFIIDVAVLAERHRRTEVIDASDVELVHRRTDAMDIEAHGAGEGPRRGHDLEVGEFDGDRALQRSRTRRRDRVRNPDAGCDDSHDAAKHEATPRPRAETPSKPPSHRLLIGGHDPPVSQSGISRSAVAGEQRLDRPR